jgi:dipeptidyl-peptidase-4
MPLVVSEDKNISYGTTVSRNEFGISGGVFISPDSSKVAFYRKDESKVSSFPLLDITTRTGSLKEIKYPMAGMDSELLALGIYDIAKGSVVYVQVDDFDQERYLTNVTWSPDNSKVFVQVVDRAQKNMRLNVYDAADGSFIKTILTESNDKFIEPLDPLYFLKGSNDLFIYRTSNRDGYRNLYLCDMDGRLTRITEVAADVAYVANDGEWIYYTSAEVSPVENHLFRIKVRNASKRSFGKPERLSQAPGWHKVAMSPDCKHYTDSYSSLTVPRVTDLCSADGKIVKNLLTAKDPTLDYAYTEIVLGTVKSADGKYDNWYWTSTPCAWNPSGSAWCVGSGTGGVGNDLRGGHNYVRPVRSSQ